MVHARVELTWSVQRSRLLALATTLVHMRVHSVRQCDEPIAWPYHQQAKQARTATTAAAVGDVMRTQDVARVWRSGMRGETDWG